MLSVQKVIRRSIDEKLAAVGVRAGIGHGNIADIVPVPCIYLAGKFIARPAGTPEIRFGVIFRKRVSALDHESFYHAVEFYAVIKPFFGELGKIRHSVRRTIRKKFYSYVSFICM